MSLDLAILGFLSQRPRTGYELKNRSFEGPLANFWTADQAQIYRTLERLRGEGLVSATRKRQAARPDRRLYEITPAGRDALEAQLSEARHLPPTRDASLVQLYFSASLEDTTLLAVLTSYREQHQARLERLRADSSRSGPGEPESPRESVMRQTALDGAIARERCTIDWLDDCIAAIEDGALPGGQGGVGQRHLFGG